ncbi:MAG: succinylglutamate desuccinylase/aspartoacylase family protein [Eubacteriales bacterium]|nr:succinylglutamate desuccinylase/aspartoacylase family protein [Christensenellaceae bacterium]MDY2750994.1 succinylglutamate desuccinylase/aspartoacylase family protein [Eubacteriales bacterium]
MKKKSTYLLIISLVFIIGLTSVLTACGETGDDNREPLTVEHITTKMLAGTRDETEVHRFVTNREGPRIVIVGGTHGDEKAGWSAALKLVKILDSEEKRRDDMCGEILIIPQVNINADKAGKRYLSTVDGVAYSDLNRSFPNGRESGAAAATIKISDAVIEIIETFEPDYVVDLHESRKSWEDGYLGNSVISDNEPFFIEDMLINYNDNYIEEGEPDFINQPAVKDGSFSKYFSAKYPDKVVFTIETNREYAGGADTIALSVRVRQQLNILNSMFDFAWHPERIEA